ncbi:MAG: hypothetical protein M1821_004153 [Bathelium mastoideum]|nr:MAG: hypothetical protein M1821_004153 [Bathelium mastoideum]KAI9685457.1 MAG: hypothetical protein M1822_004588 [Bathelium mastoideum]
MEEDVFPHAAFDLIGNPSKGEFINRLRAERKHVAAQFHGLLTKEAVDRLCRVDAAIHESIRISDVGVTTFLQRVVSKPIDLSNGIQIPPRVPFVFPTQPIYIDPIYYENPLWFDEFRFSRKLEGTEEKNEGRENSGRRMNEGPCVYHL